MSFVSLPSEWKNEYENIKFSYLMKTELSMEFPSPYSQFLTVIRRVSLTMGHLLLTSVIISSC